MNSRLRTIVFLVSVTATFSLALLLNLGVRADEMKNTPLSALSKQIDPQTAFAHTADNFDLTINIVGEGNVLRKPDKKNFSAGEVVTLTAVADAGWQFIDWSGDLMTTTSPVKITMNQNYNITATFKQRCYLLTLGHSGEGTNPVADPPKSEICSTAGQFVAGEEIILEADPALHWSVTSWPGADNPNSTAKTNTVTMPTEAHSVSVTYAPICFPLTLNWNPGQGNVTATQANCPGDSAGNKYLEGTSVGLEAAGALGYVFSSWSGTDNDSSTAKTNTVTMNSARTVTVGFKLSCHTLTRTHTPPGTGTNPAASPTFSATCNTGEYVLGEVITLTADPNEGYQVDGWQGTDNDALTTETNILTFPALAAGAGYGVGVKYIQKPTLQFKLATYQVNEDAGTATIQVERTGSSKEPVDVRYLTSNGTAKAGANNDYIAVTGKLTFGSGVLSQSFQIEINDDDLKEGSETVNLTLFDVSPNAVLGTQITAVLVILDDEDTSTVQFQTTIYETQEFSPTIPIAITLFPPSFEAVYVEFQSDAGTATSGIDYRDKFEIVRFDPGETIAQVLMTVNDDALDEPTETVNLQLSFPDGAVLGESQAIMGIIDDDDPPTLQFSESEYFADEGDLSTPVSVTLSAASAFSVTVDYEVIEVSVGRQLVGSIVFDPGETVKSIDIPTSEYQVDDTLNIILSDAEHATLSSPSSASLIILDKNRSECHSLTLGYTGYGTEPITTNMKKSLGCPLGEFVADELIFVLAQPDSGWVVNGWFGTLDNNLKDEENIVRMPDRDHVVTVFYITTAYLPVTLNEYINYFAGSQEREPNNTLAQANGPIRSGQDYFGGFSSSSDSFDNYYFYLASDGNVQIQLVDIPIGRDYNLLLLSRDQDLIGYSGSLDNNDEHISVSNLDPGLYYVSVHYGKGPTSTAKYRLNVIFE